MYKCNTSYKVKSISILVLPSIPKDSETIDSVCQRMLAKYNLSPENTKVILDSEDYGPNPSGIVRGKGEPNFIVHHKAAVTKAFQSFVKDSVMISPMFAEHDLIPHKFRLRKVNK